VRPGTLLPWLMSVRWNDAMKSVANAAELGPTAPNIFVQVAMDERIEAEAGREVEGSVGQGVDESVGEKRWERSEAERGGRHGLYNGR